MKEDDLVALLAAILLAPTFEDAVCGDRVEGAIELVVSTARGILQEIQESKP